MGDDGFYITLPCNSSRSVYPGNEISNYRTKLARPLILKGDWQVGLSEFQYPRTWETFHEVEGTFFLTDKKIKQSTGCKLRTGFYPNITEIVDEINQHAVPYNVKFGYDSLKNKTCIETTRDITIKFYGKLSVILGLNMKDKVFDPSDPPTTSERYQGRVYVPNPADIYGGIYTLFVYTDIIEHQVVGDHFVPLLRCVHISGDDKYVVTTSYDNYVRMSKSYISDIDIEVKTDQNLRVAFKYGKVVAKLHFRPVKQGLGFFF